MAVLNFDSNEIESQDSFEPVPAGWYTVVATSSEMKPTKAGNGEYLAIEFDVTSGPYKGRKLWDRLNLNNSNQVAVDIARRALAAICRAVGVLQVTDSSQLHGLPLQAKVAYVEDSFGNYGPKNEIKAYKALVGATQAIAPDPGKVAAPVNAPAAGNTPPWLR